MASTTDDLELTAAEAAAKAIAAAVDPSAITQSYYTTKSTASNYDTNAPVYEQSAAVQAAAQQLAAQQAAKPAEYQSQYASQIQDLLDKILNRGSFSYDFSSDPTYKQYAAQYQRQGKKAMQNAIGRASALTGGYGNSYAQTAGQQAYQDYLSQLNSLIPELQSNAYNRYTAEGDTMNQNLDTLQGMENTAYQQYRDKVSDYETELAYYYQMYTDMSTEEYQRYQNDLAAWESDRAYWYQKAQDAAAAAAASKKSSSSSKKSKTTTTSTIPTTYNEFVALTGISGIYTMNEFTRRKSAGLASLKGLSSYSDYLKAMFAKYS